MWFWEVDRVLLLLAMLLIAIGLVAVAAASPATAGAIRTRRCIMPAMHYFWRQLMWVCLSVPVMIGVSMLPVKVARRFALVGAAVFLVLLALVPIIGSETNGARRWLDLGVSDLQPSEFLKPFFIVGTAWMLSFRAKDPELPVVLFITGGMTAVIAVLLMLQPDFGQTIIFGTVWLILLTISGISALAIGGLIGTAIAGVVGAYLFYDTAHTRINNFLFPTKEAARHRYQVDMAHATLTAGGLSALAPAAGEMKFKLPEAHTDYIFSVIGEEFGLIACAVIVLLYVAIVVRVFVKLLDEEDSSGCSPPPGWRRSSACRR
jgi:cell division protein FtsW